METAAKAGTVRAESAQPHKDLIASGQIDTPHRNFAQCGTERSEKRRELDGLHAFERARESTQQLGYRTLYRLRRLIRPDRNSGTANKIPGTKIKT